MRRIRSRCCARATSGHVAAPPSNVMNSRRFTPMSPVLPNRKDSTALLRCGISIWSMSLVGQIRSSDDVGCTTALPPKADVDPRSCDVANVPIAT
jgi:hypothetical protein